LNSDDTYYPDAVSEAVACLQAHPDVGMVYGEAALIDEEGKVIGRFASRQTDYESLLRGSVHIPQATTFFRTELWKRVGPLDLSLFFSFDYDLWVRLAKVSKLLFVPRLWAHFRLHNLGKTIVNDDRCYPDMLRVQRREGGGWISWMRLRYYVRKVCYAWLPLRLRIWLRSIVP
jgi:hypothetical protein